MGDLEAFEAGQHEMIWFAVGLVLVNLGFIWWTVKRVRAQGRRLDEHESAINRLRTKNLALAERVSEVHAEFRQTITPPAPLPTLPRKIQRR